MLYILDHWPSSKNLVQKAVYNERDQSKIIPISKTISGDSKMQCTFYSVLGFFLSFFFKKMYFLIFLIIVCCCIILFLTPLHRIVFTYLILI